jgi:hypothetical protein
MGADQKIRQDACPLSAMLPIIRQARVARKCVSRVNV